MSRLFGSLVVLSVASLAFAADADVVVRDLRCEYMTNPLGLDTPAPRLSWTIASEASGVEQIAYQVQVGTSPEGEADLWDTGRVESAQRVHIEYAGKPLRSGQRAYWRVRVWTNRGDEPTRYSAPAWFEMGLMKPEDWTARWIGAEADRKPHPALGEGEPTAWIWKDEGDPRVTAPEGSERFFRYTFEVKEGAIERAQLLATADDRARIVLNGRQVGQVSWPVLGEFDVKNALRPGRNVLAVSAANIGGSAGLLVKLMVDGAGGKTTFTTGTQWRVSDQAAEGWEKLEFDDSGWANVREVGRIGRGVATDRPDTIAGTLPWGDLTQPQTIEPSPHFRKAFEVGRAVRAARVYLIGLGYHELYVNGRRIGDHELDPGFTRYDRRVLYVTHDVTEQVRRGENAIGVILGNGWYNFHPKAVWNFDKSPWRDAPVLRLQLHLTYEDGTQERIVTDGTWKTSPGPIISDRLFLGETYDARKELGPWSEPGFDDSGWKPVHLRRGPAGRIVAQAMPPIRVVRTIKPARITTPRPGVHVVDMGQGFAGWARIRVNAPAGTKISLKYGERLNEDGTVSQREINAHSREERFQTDEYICRGDGVETWEPRFNYHGFQWVEVHGWPGTLTVDDIDGRVVNTSFEPVGSFTCSNELLNEIQHCTLWSYGANFHGYPTDCPHREKNGWTGDAHLAAEAGLLNFNNVAAYEKWMDDLADEQRESGELPGIVPTSGWGYHWGNGPAWDSAYVLIPWYLYTYYGDRRVLEEHYAGMKKYVDYLGTRAQDHIVDFGLGDWVPVKEQTPVRITSTGYYYIDTVIVSKAAKLLGRADDAEKYAKLADQIAQSFRSKLAGPDGLYGGLQTALSCALYQGLATDAERERLVAALIANVERKDNHLDCGILGTKYLLHALTDNGRADKAYAVVAQDTFPSWGHWIRNMGATTLWEDWGGVSSRMHIMLGDVSAWFYKGLCGIYPDEAHPGFARVRLRPNFVRGLQHASAEYNSIHGRIRSEWRRENGAVRLDVEIPAGVQADLHLPSPSGERTVKQLSSGRHTFTVPD